MNRVEYTAVLDVIQKKLEGNNEIEEVLKKLETLYDYKPVTMQWHELMCKALLKSGQAEDVIFRYLDYINKDSLIKENLEIWRTVSEAYLQTGNIREGNRLRFMLSKKEHTGYFKQTEEALDAAKEALTEGRESKELLMSLESLYYTTNNKLMAYIVYLYAVEKYPEAVDADREKQYTDLDNIGYFSEYVKDKKTIIIVSEASKRENYDIASMLLHGIGVSVYLIGDRIDIEGTYSLADSVSVSMENAQRYEDCIAIPAINQTIDGRYQGNNIPYLIDTLCKQETEDDFALVLASNCEMEELRGHKDVFKRFERLSRYEAEYLEEEIGFGRAGDYYTYISRLYKADVREWINAPEECDFSIVIPTRNASETLYHTLRTCLEQEYSGSYEVVLSDNSTEDSTSVYEIYKRFEDSRLKYYRTPRDLNLVKSYEFAYLQTRGRFILSLGSDDGALPWALKILNDVMSNKQCASFNIITWPRGFYAWPGFNGGQQNMQEIPMFIKKDNVSALIDNADTMLGYLIENASMMYTFPNMYINSGFKREYLKVLYDKTGALLDGLCQDIHMGALNYILKSSVLRIEYPLTIAGMSANSVGSIGNKIGEGVKQKDIQKVSAMQLGGRGLSSISPIIRSKYVPNTGNDVTGIYQCVHVIMKKGLISEDFFAGQNTKKIYLNCYNVISYLDDTYHKFIMEGQETAKKISDEFADWYEKEILSRAEGVAFCNKEQKAILHTTKRYEEGYTANGGVILDASRFGVTNIYEAVQLFKNFLHF